MKRSPLLLRLMSSQLLVTAYKLLVAVQKILIHFISIDYNSKVAHTNKYTLIIQLTLVTFFYILSGKDFAYFRKAYINLLVFDINSLILKLAESTSVHFGESVNWVNAKNL